MRFARAVVALSAIPFAAIGAAFLLFPTDLARFVGLHPTGATADADVRAVYGGLQLGCAFFLGAAAWNREWCRAGLTAQIALYGGLASARFISYSVAGLPSPLGIALHAGEVIGLALGVLAWFRLQSGERRAAA